MNFKSSRVRISEEELNYRKNNYSSEPVQNSNRVVSGNFLQEENNKSLKEVLIKRSNKAFCYCLSIAISLTFISYYVAMNYEAKLNSLDNEIVRLNTENQDLQSELDKYKSFNNVDNKIGQYNSLQKADKVIEVTALNTTNKEVEQNYKTASNNFDWAIGY